MVRQMGGRRSVGSLAARMDEDIIKTSARYSDLRCIYRVPSRFRLTNEQAYTPELVSIGPLHHNHTSLRPFEAHKRHYLHSFPHDSRTSADLVPYLRFIRKHETRIRECYADNIHLPSDEFTQMILVDSVFLIEFLRRWLLDPEEEDDYIFKKPFLKWAVKRDIRLAENQLPLFVVAGIYRKAFSPTADEEVRSFKDLACKSFNFDVSRGTEAGCCHLLDLYEAGVRLRPSNSGKFLDIRFDAHKGILTIPTLRVMDNTESYFRNLIAFELCHYKYRDTYISDYQHFLNCLINTPEDVQLLTKVGIVDKWIGSNREVCDIINTASKNIIISTNSYNYLDISEQLNCYRRKRWNKYRAVLLQEYLKHPWTVTALVSAAVLLVFNLPASATVLTSSMLVP